MVPHQARLGPRRPGGLRNGFRLELRPGWPLTATLIGYPLWWLLGIAGIVPLVAAAIMAVELAHRPNRVRVRRGFGLWLVFLAWVALGVVLLQVSAPHAIADHSNGRYVTFAFRLGWYVAATIAMVYVYNTRDRLPTIKIIRAFGWMFLTVVCGGFIGSLASTVDFPSLLELLLPGRLTHIQYVHDLIHPVVAQLYTADGLVNPRASAPFAYTNDWGLNFACLLPLFIQGWIRDANGLRRRIGVAILAASIYPAVVAQNRGMWLALVVVAIVIAIRSAIFGRLRTIALVGALAVVLGGLLLGTPLGHTITHRLDNGYSNAGRASLGQLTVDSVMSRSPVVGLGSTRNVEGSFYSIAGGNTATCGLCTPPALGTQGHFWLLIFSTGVGGLLLYLAFIAINLITSARRDSPLATITLAVLTIHLVTMFVYDAIGIELVTIFGVIGLLWRDLATSPKNTLRSRTQPGAGAGDRTLEYYRRLVRSNLALFAVVAGLGASAGLVTDRLTGRTVTAETKVLVPPNAVFPTQEQFSQSMDTIAGLLDSRPVRHAVRSAIGTPAGEVASHLSVAATPNSRILLVRYSDTVASRAARGSRAAAKALLTVRTKILMQSRRQGVDSLSKEGAGVAASIATLTKEHESAGVLVKDLASLDAQVTALEDTTPTGGSLIADTTLRFTGHDSLVAAINGLASGLLIATIISYLRQGRKRVGQFRRSPFIDDLWILDRVTHESIDADTAPGHRLDRTVTGLYATKTARVVGVDDDVASLVKALQDRLICEDRGHCGVALVASGETGIHRVVVVRDRVERSGLAVTGIVIADSNRRRSRRAS